MNYNKIFVIGLNKQATRSIHALFIDNGYNALHWRPHNELNKIPGPDEIIKHNIEYNMTPLLDKYENYQVFSDIHYISINFELFDQAYPNSLFILNFRDINKWICSRLNHRGTQWGYVKFWKTRHKKEDYTFEQVIDAWTTEYNNHFKKVIEYFKDKPSQIIIYNIDTESIYDFANKLPFNMSVINSHKIGETNLTRNKWVYIDGNFTYI